MELADLLSEFESLGDNCEFGIVHRAANAKGRGLFQWAGMPLANLIPALYTRFHGLDNPANFKIVFHGDEYMIYLEGFGFRTHTGLYKTTTTNEKVIKETSTRMRYLIRKLIQDLEEGTKIFVFRQNEPTDCATIDELRNAVACYGSNTLLWVVEDPNLPQGTITWLGDGLMKGSLAHLSSRKAVAGIWPYGWHKVLWNAYVERATGGDSTHLSRTLEALKPGRIVLHASFRSQSPPEITLSSGWGAVEEHQTWSGPESTMLIHADLPEGDLLVRVEGSPFVSHTEGPRMVVSANGLQVKKYELIPRNFFQFRVTSAVIRKSETLLFKFEFPNAGTPASIGVGTSARVLGYAFRSLTIFTLGS